MNCTAESAVRFHCYENPRMPIMVYQIGQANCTDKKPATTSSVENVMCVYTAICEVLGPNDKPTKLNAGEVESYVDNFVKTATSSFKNSTVSCTGTGALDPNNVFFGNCPPIEKCQQDVSFNATAAMVQRQFGKSVLVESPKFEKTGR